MIKQNRIFQVMFSLSICFARQSALKLTKNCNLRGIVDRIPLPQELKTMYKKKFKWKGPERACGVKEISFEKIGFRVFFRISSFLITSRDKLASSVQIKLFQSNWKLFSLLKTIIFHYEPWFAFSHVCTQGTLMKILRHN